MQQLEEVVGQARAEIEGVSDIATLDEIRVKYLGKKGFFTEQMKGLGALSAEERPAAGAVINQAKQQVQDALNERREALEVAVLNQKLAAETIDVSLPGRRIENGGLHPVTRTIERIERLFGEMGFK
ncbi:MAG: phenylalanine--tRNA ligase subunit alpha, partial [Aeromonas veronii]